MINTEIYKKAAFLAILAIFSYLFYLMIKPYLTYAILGLILGIGAYPLFKKISEKIKNQRIAGLTTVFIIILIIIIPAIIILTALVGETISFFTNLNITQVQAVADSISKIAGNEINIYPYLNNIISSISQAAINSTWNIIGSVTDMLIGMLLMFTIIYFCFIDGPVWIKRLSIFAPFESSRKQHLVDQIKSVTKTVIYVEILIAIIQGIIGGIGFYLAGIPNPFFWGFVMALLAFLPFVGTGFIWVPAGIIKIANSELGTGIFILTYGVIMIAGIDYYLRPRFISGATRIHPLTALLGAFGGLKLFGFPGLIIGPLIAAILEAVIIFHCEDYEVKDVKKRKKKTKLD